MTGSDKLKKHEKKKKRAKLQFPEKKQKAKPVLHQDTVMKVARIIFWALLLFIFIKGVVHMLTPSADADEVRQMLNDFKAQYENNSQENEGVYSFAQNFVKEYLTYSNDYEEEYKERIKQYVTDELYSKELLDFKGNSEVTYVEAYKKEQYSENQVDVYVVADVQYAIQQISEDGENYDTLIKTGTSIVKVPVYIRNNKYVVEDIPEFINDDMKLENHESQEYAAERITDENEIESVEEFLNNFFKAYYEEDQSVIDYYIKQGIEENFIGLQGRYLFVEISELRLYQDAEENTAITFIKVKDSVNDATLSQSMNLKLQKDGDRYYITDINTKTINLKEN